MRYGKNGQRLSPVIIARLKTVMTDPAFDGANQRAIAAAVGVSERTVRNYLTDEVWGEIRADRLKVVAMELGMVDQAMYRKALSGDVAAARLIYARWEALKQEGEAAKAVSDLSLAELEVRLVEVQGEIEKMEEGE